MGTDGLWKWLEQNWMGLFAVIIGILGITIAVLSRKTKRLCYILRSNTLIENSVAKMKNLQIAYAGEPVENVTVTRFVLWNSGTDTVDGDAIVSRNPIAVRTIGACRILEAKIIRTTGETNRFRVIVDRKSSSVICRFDYLDSAQGAAVQIVHSASDDKGLEVSGTIKGGKMLRVTPYTEVNKWSKPSKLTVLLARATPFYLSVGPMLLGLYGFWSLYKTQQPWIVTSIAVVVSLLFLCVGCYLLRVAFDRAYWLPIELEQSSEPAITE